MINKGKVLIIGAGGVGRVVAHKCAQNPGVFAEICLASRTLSKCQEIQRELSHPIKVARVDADNVPELVALIRSYQAAARHQCGPAIPGPDHYGCLS